MEGRKRQAGIELLRMVAMMMIVTMHFLANSGNLFRTGKNHRTFQLFWERSSKNFCLAAVNAYVFISGYFGYQGTFQVKKSPEVPLPDLVLQPAGSPCTDGFGDQHRLSERHLWNPSLSVSD